MSQIGDDNWCLCDNGKTKKKNGDDELLPGNLTTTA